MIRLLFFSFLALCSFQCYPTVEYDGSRRIEVSGLILNENGKPIAGVPFILTSVVGYKEEGGVEITSSGVSDENGVLKFVIADDNAESYRLLLNRQYNLVGFNYAQIKTIENLSSMSIDINPSIIQQFELDLGKITLKEGTSLTLSCDNAVTGKVAFLSIYTSDTLTIGKKTFFNNDLDLDTYDVDVCNIIADPFNVSKNSRVLLTYNKDSEFKYDTIIINQEPVTYFF